LRRSARSIIENADALTASAEALHRLSIQMLQHSSEASGNATGATEAGKEISQNIEVIAAGSEKMLASMCSAKIAPSLIQKDTAGAVHSISETGTVVGELASCVVWSAASKSTGVTFAKNKERTRIGCAQDKSDEADLGLLFTALGLLLRKLLLQLFATLRTGFGTLLAFLIQHLLRPNQLNERLLGAIATLKAGADNPQIAAVAIAVPRRNCLEQPRNSLAGLQISKSLTPRMQVTLLSERNELLNMRTHGLGLGDRGRYAILENDGRHQVPQQSAAMAGVPSQFESCIAVTHGKSLSIEKSSAQGQGSQAFLSPEP
jgi:hypothetical protein